MKVTLSRLALLAVVACGQPQIETMTGPSDSADLPEDEARFWNLIHSSFATARTEFGGIEALAFSLEKMPRAEVIAFQDTLTEVIERAATYELQGGACLVGHGNSDDGFLDFRAWLIAQGRDTFETVLDNPDALAQVPFRVSPAEEWYLEEMHTVAFDLITEGEPMWPYDLPVYLGIKFDLTKSELRSRYPALWSKFGDRYLHGMD